MYHCNLACAISWRGTCSLPTALSNPALSAFTQDVLAKKLSTRSCARVCQPVSSLYFVLVQDLAMLCLLPSVETSSPRTLFIVMCSGVAQSWPCSCAWPLVIVGYVYIGLGLFVHIRLQTAFRTALHCRWCPAPQRCMDAHHRSTCILQRVAAENTHHHVDTANPSHPPSIHACSSKQSLVLYLWAHTAPPQHGKPSGL